jgi:hypothetical protein
VGLGGGRPHRRERHVRRARRRGGHPRHRRRQGRGLGAEIIDRGEAFARTEHAKKILLAAPEPDTAGRALFELRGYREVRRFYSMAIELTEAPSEPVLSDGLVVDELRDDEYDAFYAALNESFAEHWEWHPKPFDEWLELRQGPAPR